MCGTRRCLLCGSTISVCTTVAGVVQGCGVATSILQCNPLGGLYPHSYPNILQNVDSQTLGVLRIHDGQVIIM